MTDVLVKRERPSDLLLLALWFALTTGIGEVCLQAIRQVGLGRIIQISPDYVWMAPLANIFYFAIPGLIFYGMARLRPNSVSLRAVLAVFCTIFYFSLIKYGPLHYVAVLFLSMGLAAETSRQLAKHREAFFRFVRFTTGGFGLLGRRTSPASVAEATASGNSALSRRDFLASSGLAMGGLFGGVQGWALLTEQGRLGQIPPAVKGRPNVLLVVMDTVRSADMSFMGYGRSTMPRLARRLSTGVSFERAITAAPWTLPSHASIFTGRWHQELSADWRTPLDDTFPTLAEYLASNGYVTAGFVANTFFAGYEHGLDRGFAHYEDYRQTPSQIAASTSIGRTLGCWNRTGPGCELRPLIGYYDLMGSKPAPVLRESFLNWHADRDRERPYFAFLNFFDAHAPYTPPADYANLFGDDARRRNPMQLQEDEWVWTPDQVAAEHDAYDASIRFIDDQLDLMLGELERRGALDDTVVIVTSDHGEEFMEHGVMSHANSLYLPSLHVPLFVRYPASVPGGVRVSRPVTMRDVAATIVDLAGVAEESPFPGSSLAAHWTLSAAAPAVCVSAVTGIDYRPPSYPVSRGSMESVVHERHHYILNGDGKEELYDVVTDPWEKLDLAESPEGAAQLPTLRRLLEENRTSHARSSA